MVTIKQDKYGNYVEGFIQLELRAYLTNVNLGDKIENKEALDHLSKELDNLAGSNNGIEELANANIKLIE